VQEEERTKGKEFRPGMAFYRRGRVRGWRIRRWRWSLVELVFGSVGNFVKGREWLHFP
jgi:hypothetical protein